MKGLNYKLEGEVFTLLPERAIFWERESAIIISDLHLGKAGHFRKHGIPITKKVHHMDLRIVEALLNEYPIKEVILLGDLFHSYENNEWLDFIRFMEVFSHVNFILVKGNHDILESYPDALKVVDRLTRSNFCFTHEMEKTKEYNISGHIHPGFRIRGIAREGLTLPCFYFSKEHAVLPAFGQFTGLKKIRPKDGDKIFGIAENDVIELV